MRIQTHGGDVWSCGNKGILDFSASLNPLGMPPQAAAAAVQGVSASVHYPDPTCSALRRAIARAQNIPEEWILCGNGAAELLDRMTLALRPKKALLPAPAFGEYQRSLEAAGCKVVYHDLKPEREFDLNERILRFLPPSLDLLVLCNPNNPTARAISPALLYAIVERCAELDITLLVDESFLELTDPERRTDLTPFLESRTKLILLRSLTKSYCIPGLRLGYLLTANASLREQLSACGQPWSVSVPAQFAGIAAMSRPDWPELGRRVIVPQRERLTAELRRLGLRVWDSHANFILFRSEGFYALREQMLEQGVLIRSCAGFRGLNEAYYRIAVRTEEENTVLLKALRKCLEQDF